MSYTKLSSDKLAEHYTNYISLTNHQFSEAAKDSRILLDTTEIIQYKDSINNEVLKLT